MPNIITTTIPVTEHSGEPRVLDVDLGAALEMARPTNIRQQIEKHMDVLGRFGEVCTQRVQNAGPGRPSVAYLLNEHHAAYLATQSDTPKAKDVTVGIINAFIEWRRTRAAAPAPQFAIPQTMAEALRLAADLSETVEEQKAALAEAAPKVAFHDAVTDATNAQTVEEVAKALNIGRNRMFRLLREHKLLMPGNMPYQRHIDAGRFRVVERQYTDAKRGEKHTYTRTLVTGKGFAYIQAALAAHLPQQPPPAPVQPEAA